MNKNIGDKVYWRSRGLRWIKDEDLPHYIYYMGKIVDIEKDKYYVVEMADGTIRSADFDLLTNGYGGADTKS